MPRWVGCIRGQKQLLLSQHSLKPSNHLQSREVVPSSFSSVFSPSLQHWERWRLALFQVRRRVMGLGTRSGDEQSMEEHSRDSSPLFQNSGFQNRAPIQEIIKGAFGCLSGCLTVISWWVVRCFELNQTCIYPQSNSVMWLLILSYVASGNKAIF